MVHIADEHEFSPATITEWAFLDKKSHRGGYRQFRRLPVQRPRHTSTVHHRYAKRPDDDNSHANSW